MTASIYDFLANFQGGGARPNRYRVILTFPGTVPAGLQASNKISFTCSAAAIPASSLGVVDVPYMGRQVKVPGDKIWEDWNVQILLDNDFIGRSAFESWHDQLLGFRSNVAQADKVNPINAYARAQVNCLDRADNVTQIYRIDGMFPINVGEVQLGYDQNDQVALQPVTFAINGWSSGATRN